MKGRRPKRKSGSKKASTPKVTSTTSSSRATKGSNGVPSRDLTTVSPVSPGTVSSSPCTPKRSKRQRGRSQEPCLSSTPVHSSSADILSSVSVSPPGAKQVKLEYTKLVTQLKTSEVEVESPCCKSKSRTRRWAGLASQPRQLRQRPSKEQTQTSTPTAKSRCGRTRKSKTGNLKGKTTRQLPKRSRPRFELKKPDVAEQDESLLSSDLSIELSHHEELPSFSCQEGDDDVVDDGEEEEELPSFLMQVDKKPPSIREGVFVWYKCRNYPFWPAWVKSVNRKQKKASIMFIDNSLITEKRKGFAVALRSLKPFDCEKDNELLCKAKEEYDAAVTWSLDLITDYGYRIACGSFSGSFIEYVDHGISYPVRRKYPQAASERLTIASDTMMEESFDDHTEDSFSEQQEDVSRSSKRLLPDRTHAAHNRANERLVHFIVKQRMVEERLLAVIHGQQQSRWLHSFLTASRKGLVHPYLEDDQQLDKVYRYLEELYVTAVATTPSLPEAKSMEHVSFVLYVLLPEAIIHAIAGVDNVSVAKAEEKYIKGRCISNRERQEFDLSLERLMKKKSQHPNTEVMLLSDSIS